MSIYSKIIDIQKLGQAWDRVRKNKPAPGVDNVTFEMFEERRREELRQLNLELSEHRYESLPVKLTNLFLDKSTSDALLSVLYSWLLRTQIGSPASAFVGLNATFSTAELSLMMFTSLTVLLSCVTEIELTSPPT